MCAAAAGTLSPVLYAAETSAPKETYENQAKGLRILPGAWRPHYPWEHIVWISPSWPSQDYLWLDFPEAIFTDRGLIYLSHVNPAAPAVYTDWPRVEWKRKGERISYKRVLPDGVAFSGAVQKEKDNVAGLELRIRNGSKKPLKQITLQTCAFLRAIKEFNDFTPENKYVHVPDKGWTRVKEVEKQPEDKGKYGIGWRTRRNHKCDVPMMVTVSNAAERLVAMTWLDATLSMVQNPGHPCMHADPQFRDLVPGEEQTIHGRIIFHEGTLQEFKYEQYL